MVLVLLLHIIVLGGEELALWFWSYCYVHVKVLDVIVLDGKELA